MSADAAMAAIMELIAVERLKLQELTHFVQAASQRQEAASQRQEEILLEILHRLDRSSVSSVTANSSPDSTAAVEAASTSTLGSASHGDDETNIGDSSQGSFVTVETDNTAYSLLFHSLSDTSAATTTESP